jgi:cob(I)alamin adenosyltransferase
MRIYTRTGDGGETGLFGGGRVSKTHDRIAAYGEADELNAALGWCAVAAEGAPGIVAGLKAALEREQGLLLTAGAWLATPPEAREARRHLPEWPAGADAALEREIDAWDAALPPLKSFILPGGSELAARLHIARAVCRRAERAVCALAAGEAHGVDPRILAWLNRLSDWLFTAARAANAAAGRADAPWRPAP